MFDSVSYNKNGQTLGRKGLETRQRLMAAASRLLPTMSPLDLTVVAIAKEADTASPTFYIYFDDVADILFALSEAASEEMMTLLDDKDLLTRPDRLIKDAMIFIDGLNRIWDEHSDILSYRNLEADRGNPRFAELRITSSIPVLNRLAELILAAYPPERRPRRVEAYAEGVVIFAAIERLAATTHQTPRRGLRPEELRKAQARVLARTLEPR